MCSGSIWPTGIREQRGQVSLDVQRTGLGIAHDCHAQNGHPHHRHDAHKPVARKGLPRQFGLQRRIQAHHGDDEAADDVKQVHPRKPGKQQARPFPRAKKAFSRGLQCGMVHHHGHHRDGTQVLNGLNLAVSHVARRGAQGATAMTSARAAAATSRSRRRVCRATHTL
jgi:hypothetical protein